MGNKKTRLGKADLHIHSHYSDAEMSVKEILDYIQEKTDLDVIAICDHDTMKGAYEAVTLMENGSYRFELILGYCRQKWGCYRGFIICPRRAILCHD